jgi:digeranylgeranylglycerophospholipid reductase
LRKVEAVPHEYPITVIGGGPCGSFTALTIARSQVPVTVLEEHETIGSPSHCAGHVGKKSLSKVGLAVPEEIVQNRIRGARFYSPLCHELVLDHGSTVTYVLNRAKFDKWLAERAVESGATYILNSRVRSITFDERPHKLVVEKSDYRKELPCNLVIDAQGYPASLPRATSIIKTHNSRIVNGVLAEADNLTDVDDEFVELYFGNEYAPGFFAWIIPKRDGSAKIGLGAKGQDPINLLHTFSSRHPVASKKLRGSKIFNLTVHPIPLSGPLTQTYADGLLLVGDAASQVKPTTGGGIVTGILCSKIAGEVAAQSWKQSVYTAEFLSRYQSQWKKALSKDFLVMSRIRTYLDKLSDAKLDNLFELALKTGLMNDLRTMDDIDFQGHSLLNLAKRPRTIANIIRFVWQALRI